MKIAVTGGSGKLGRTVALLAIAGAERLSAATRQTLDPVTIHTNRENS